MTGSRSLLSSWGLGALGIHPSWHQEAPLLSVTCTTTNPRPPGPRSTNLRAGPRGCPAACRPTSGVLWWGTGPAHGWPPPPCGTDTALLCCWAPAATTVLRSHPLQGSRPRRRHRWVGPRTIHSHPWVHAVAWENLRAAAHGEGAVKGALTSALTPQLSSKTPLSLGTGAPQEPEGKNDQMSSNTRWTNRVWPVHTLEYHSAAT